MALGFPFMTITSYGISARAYRWYVTDHAGASPSRPIEVRDSDDAPALTPAGHYRYGMPGVLQWVPGKLPRVVTVGRGWLAKHHIPESALKEEG